MFLAYEIWLRCNILTESDTEARSLTSDVCFIALDENWLRTPAGSRPYPTIADVIQGDAEAYYNVSINLQRRNCKKRAKNENGCHCHNSSRI